VKDINDQIRDFVYDQSLEEYRDNERENNVPYNYMIEQLTLSVLALMKQIDARVFGEGSEQWTLDNIEEICRSHDFGDIMDSWIKNM
jgi:esterase/lipase superfamily enzyme